MSCHNFGFSPHNPDDLARALAKQKITCETCKEYVIPLSEGAKVVFNKIIYRTHCDKCNLTTVREIHFYAPKDF